jgi:PAS domain-containing protein
MSSHEVRALLDAWRAADRRWEAISRDDPGFPAAAIEVVRAWLAYHRATDGIKPGEIALITDEERVYVAVTPEVESALGYPPAAVLGKRVDDLAAPEVAESTAERWDSFVLEGRQDGFFPMLRSDGSVVTMGYQARAHYPIAGFHLSRLWPATPEALPADRP